MIDTEILEAIDKLGYEVVRIGRANVCDMTYALDENGGYLYASGSQPAHQIYPRIIVRKKTIYRAVSAPQDLGKTCEFSNDPNFERTKIGNLCLIGTHGYGTYETIANKGYVTYEYCRIAEDEQ